MIYRLRQDCSIGISPLTCHPGGLRRGHAKRLHLDDWRMRNLRTQLLANCWMRLNLMKKALHTTPMRRASSVLHGEHMNALSKYPQHSWRKCGITPLNPTKYGLRHVRQTILNGSVRISRRHWNIADKPPTFFQDMITSQIRLLSPAITG